MWPLGLVTYQAWNLPPKFLIAQPTNIYHLIHTKKRNGKNVCIFREPRSSHLIQNIIHNIHLELEISWKWWWSRQIQAEEGADVTTIIHPLGCMNCSFASPEAAELRNGKAGTRQVPRFLFTEVWSQNQKRGRSLFGAIAYATDEVQSRKRSSTNLFHAQNLHCIGVRSSLPNANEFPRESANFWGKVSCAGKRRNVWEEGSDLWCERRELVVALDVLNSCAKAAGSVRAPPTVVEVAGLS